MKTLLLSTVLLATGIAANAQHLDLGVHCGFGTTWMINKNVNDQGANLDPETSFGPVFGVHGTYVLPSNFGLYLGVDMAMDQQKYKGDNTFGTGSASSYKATDKISYIEVPVLVRKYTNGGLYFELGPKFSFLSSAKETVELSPNNTNGYKDMKVSTGYKKMVVSGVIGIGGQFGITKNLFAEVGLRLAYGFTDATKEFSATELNGPIGHELSIGSGYAHIDQNLNVSYKSTHLATGHVIAGLSYRLPMAKKAAGETKK